MSLVNELDLCAHDGLLAFEEARARILAAVSGCDDSEIVPLDRALDRVVAKPIVAPISIPNADNSAMDGYALSFAQAHATEGDTYSVIGTAFAGHPFLGRVEQGQAVRIMTGGVIPNGAVAVVMQEHCERVGDTISLTSTVPVGANIRRIGDDIREGDLVLAQGTLLGPRHIGLLASLGMAEVAVARKIRVALLTTGDELLPLGAAPEQGKPFDSNRAALAALLTRLPVELIDLGMVNDNEQAIRNAIDKALLSADVLITTGGVSVGEADFTGPILAEKGQVAWWKIAMKPGKPVAFGALQHGDKSVWFFGLPGNPVSSIVTYHQLVVPALIAMSGQSWCAPTLERAKARHAIKKQPGRLDFQRGYREYQGGVWYVSSAGLQSSAVMSAMVRANCYIVLSRDSGSVDAETWVDVLPFDRYIE